MRIHRIAIGSLLRPAAVFTRHNRAFSASTFSVPLEDCIKSKTICSALSSPQFNVTKFTPHQKDVLSALASSSEPHIFLNGNTGSGKSLLALIFIVAQFIGAHRQLVKLKSSYMKPCWLIVLPTPQLSSQLERWTAHLLPETYVDLFFNSYCLMGTPKRLLQTLVEEKWTPKYLKGIFIDEVDSILQPKSRYTPRKHRFKPSPGTSLVQTIMALNTDTRIGAPALPRLILASATLNSRVKSHLFELGYFSNDKRKTLQLITTSGDLSQNLDNTPTDENGLFLHPEEGEKVSHFVYLTTLEDEDQDDRLDMSMESKATVIATMLLEEQSYHNSIITLFLPKTLSKSQFASKLMNEYEEARTAEHIPKLNVSFFSEKLFTEPNTTKIYIGSEEDSRGIDFGGIKAVFIVGPITSFESYLHMSGRVGRYSSCSAGQHVISLLSQTELSEFQNLIRRNQPSIRLYRWRPST